MASSQAPPPPAADRVTIATNLLTFNVLNKKQNGLMAWLAATKTMNKTKQKTPTKQEEHCSGL